MGGSPFLIFFSLGGLVIVVGGVITVAFMSFETEEVRKALDVIVRMFKDEKKPKEDLHNDVTAIIYLARLLIEKKSLRNLESIINKSGIRDPFLRYGLNMVLSDYPSEDIRSMLETAAEASYERASIPVDILQAMTSHGPAFGMVGTLIGMIAMMCNLTDNISAIGPSLAVAFLSTLYGVLSARMLYIPAATLLRQEVERRHFRNRLVTEGMVMLVAKKAPMYVQDRLNSFLRPEVSNYLDILRGPRPVAIGAVSAKPPGLTAAAVAA
jgi:chemotaxis protein MotA